MSTLAAPMTVLAWLGRQGTRAIAAVVLIAIVVPPVDAVLKPYVSEAIFALLCIAFIRVDTAQLRGHLERPGSRARCDSLDVTGDPGLDRRWLALHSRPTCARPICFSG
jgi:hypothetical protein